MTKDQLHDVYSRIESGREGRVYNLDLLRVIRDGLVDLVDGISNESTFVNSNITSAGIRAHISAITGRKDETFITSECAYSTVRVTLAPTEPEYITVGDLKKLLVGVDESLPVVVEGSHGEGIVMATEAEVSKITGDIGEKDFSAFSIGQE